MLPLLAMRLGPLDFSDPLWLFALLLLLPILYLWKTSRVPGSPLRRWTSLILRAALVIALVFSLAGTRLVWFSKGICVVFVLDQSQSVPGSARDNARDAIAAQLQKMKKDDRFVVVEFGGDAVLESLPSAGGQMPPQAGVADSAHTDIARALRLAIASFPIDRQKRIVLFSDGNQNAGDALREARIAAAQDVDVNVVLLAAAGGGQGHETMVDQVIVPTHVRKDANFAIRAIITSDIPQSVHLLVTRDGLPMRIANDQINLLPGSNVVDIPDSLADGGYHGYDVTIRPDNPAGDTFAANNTGYAFTTVDAPGKVLIVRGKPNTRDYLSPALQSKGLTVETVNTNAIPASVKDFAQFDCVILDDVNAGPANFSPTQVQQLALWVKDYGGGLVLIGGDDSFGPGGYANTPIEDVAPVTMDLKRKKNISSLAIVIVNDKSGSMGEPAQGGVGLEKMDLANQGSIDVIKSLDVNDYGMVGAVDTECKWMADPRLLQMTPANKNIIIKNTLSCKAGGGGIYCETALYHAYRLINASNVNVMAKHVIMFSDAQDAEEKGSCVAMARQNYDRNGVTTSCIGLGNQTDPDVPFLREVAGNPRGPSSSGATNGHGRCYITNNAMDLPRIFAKEAFIVAKKPFVENANGISLTRYTSPLLQGFDGGLPKVYGYVGTTLKGPDHVGHPGAVLDLHGESADDPVLSHWVIGLGKCVAYTSDDSSRWGKDWVAWPGYDKFWAQVVRWVSRSALNNGLATTTVIEGAQGRVIVDAADDQGKPINNLPNLKAKVIRPNQDSASSDVDLIQVAPGRYEARFPAPVRGTYLVSVYDGQTNNTLSTGGGVLSYPPEYRDLRPNAPLLHALADATTGKFLDSVDSVFASKPDPVRSFWPLWEPLLIFLAIAFLLDVAWRRLNIADWFRPASQPYRALFPQPARGENLRAFRSIKTSRKAIENQHESLRERIEILVKSPSNPTPAPTPGITIPGLASPLETPSSESTPQKPAAYANRLLDAKKRAAAQIRDQSDTTKPS